MILAIALLIDALLGITLYMVVRIARNTAYEVVVKSHESMLERMDQTLTNLENVCYVMAYSSAVQSILTDKEVTFPLVDYHKPVRTSFAVAFACSPAIIGIGLYDNELTYLLSSGNNLFGVEPLPEDCYRISTPQYHVVEQDKATALLLVYPIYRDSRVDSVIKVKIGYLAITIGDGLLKELVEQSDHVEDTLIAFTDQQGNMIYSNQPVEEDSFRHRMASGDSISSVIQHTGWQLHSIISNRSISDNMKPVVIIIGIIVALLLVLFFWLKHFFNKQIILPLNDLQQFMAKNSDIHQRLTPNPNPTMKCAWSWMFSMKCWIRLKRVAKRCWLPRPECYMKKQRSSRWKSLPTAIRSTRISCIIRLTAFVASPICITPWRLWSSASHCPACSTMR